jgi:hypothetical protein
MVVTKGDHHQIKLKPYNTFFSIIVSHTTLYLSKELILQQKKEGKWLNFMCILNLFYYVSHWLEVAGFKEK